ncbi:hypothetical protein BS47DRAFT_1357669 [Hydnum rufescens UP504]|uniref:Uncharacterized protein n=1 Tax=Hydnum rufescens UP504 TaxID=1448309 RepID=A0A9P6E2F3_9AGAM|nr:hypothetical protein BS47DRAFT_1357669 [Hydnum rufescens UP504]
MTTHLLLQVSSFTRTNSNTKPPAAPGIDTRPVRTGMTHITTYPNKSPHLKSRTVHGHGVKRGTTHPPWWILNSNLYEPAEPNPMTPNPPNERRPTNACPTNARETNTRPMNTRPTKTRHTNTTRPPKPDNPPNEHGQTASRQTKLSKPHTHQSRSFPSAKTHPTRTSCTIHPLRRVHFTAQHPTRRMHRSGPGQNTGPRSHPYPPILDFPQHIRGRNKYSATHPLQRVSPLPDIRLDKCTDQVQSKTQDRAAPHTPDPQFSATMKHETNTVPHTRRSGLSYNRYCL